MKISQNIYYCNVYASLYGEVLSWMVKEDTKQYLYLGLYWKITAWESLKTRFKTNPKPAWAGLGWPG